MSRFENLSDRELIELCSDDKNVSKVCNNDFFKERTKLRYPLAYSYNFTNSNWRKKYLEIVYYKDKLKRDFAFDFVDGNAEKFYEIIESGNFDEGLIYSAELGNLNNINYFIYKGATDFDRSAREAAAQNNFDLVDYFINKGAKDFDTYLKYAVKYNNENAIKYLTNKGGR